MEGQKNRFYSDAHAVFVVRNKGTGRKAKITDPVPKERMVMLPRSNETFHLCFLLGKRPTCKHVEGVSLLFLAAFCTLA